MLVTAGTIIAIAGIAAGHFATRVWAAYRFMDFDRMVNRLADAGVEASLTIATAQDRIWTLESELTVERNNRITFMESDLERRLTERKNKRHAIQIQHTLTRIRRASEAADDATVEPANLKLVANGK